MSPEKHREIASLGGKTQGWRTNPGNFANDPKRASLAGRTGGKSQGKRNNAGNFANNRERAAEAGRKGGSHAKRRV